MSSDSKLVYSTTTGREKDNDTKSTWTPSQGPAKMRLETAARGGKSVTVLFNLPLNEDDAKKLLKDMQSQFGCGGTMKDQTLELRGDVRQKVEMYFAKKQLKLVRAGG